MTTTLTNGATTLALPDDLLWADEFAWQEVAQNKRYSITGRLIVESALRVKGRPITLAGNENHAWITRVNLLTLLAWKAIPGQVFNLVLRSEPVRTVQFDHEAGAIEAAPVVDYADPTAADNYIVTLKFIEV